MAITYTPTTNFGAKDSLPTNDPDKVIKGSEFTTEFTALQTAFSLAAPNASPTFTGTVTIPTADINGGAIDGTTIGGTTPAAATFTSVTATTADINGGTIDGTVIGGATPAAGSFTTGQFGTSLNVDGTVTADGLTVDGNTYTTGNSEYNSGITYNYTNREIRYYNTANDNWAAIKNPSTVGDLRITTGGGAGALFANNGDISFYEDTGTTPKFFWDASAESLGIGTSSPGTTLHAVGGNVWSSNFYEVGRFQKTSGTGVSLGYDNSAYVATVGAYSHDGTASSLAFWTYPGTGTALERMRIDSAGNVALTGNETELLFHSNYVVGNTDRAKIKVIGAGGGSGYGGDLTFSTKNSSNVYSEAMRIDSSGNVGIGTTSPSAKVHAYSTSGFTAPPLICDDSVSAFRVVFNPSTYAGVPANKPWLHSYDDIYIGSDAGASVKIMSGGTNTATFDSSGNLLVGTTTANGKISLTFGSTGYYAETAQDNANFFYLLRSGVTYARHIISGSSYQIINFTSGGVSLSAGGTSWGAVSDEREKDIIEPINNAAEKVASLRAVIGKYKKDDPEKRRAFLIAQDVQAVLPEAVYKNSEDDDTLNLAYTDTIPLLVAAIQEQQEIINDLRARVAQLEGA